MARLFTPDWLDELKSRCDIIDLISRYVPLKRNGREFVGCCPFHHEKTPSFFVYPESQSYHCFGCKESGDAIKFLSKYENLGFIESVERLANSVNLPLPEMKGTDAENIEQKKKERTQLLSALKEAGRYYFDNLFVNHPQAQLARDYLAKRQINKQSIVRFGLGCSLDWDSLIKHMNGKGYSNEILKKAGLIGERVNQYGTVDKVFDAFGGRLTFPLINKEGEVIGFSARLLEDKDLAKYKNTSATPVFNKSEVIFGINLLKKLRDENRGKGFEGLENLIIVEGQIDVITMHQFGFTNTVACLGTALTPMHARKLKQFSENIILLLDGDSAGQKATLRSIDVLRSVALNVRVCHLPEGKDPDEFLHTYGADAMRKLLSESTDGVQFKIDVLAQKYDLNKPNERAKFVQESLVVIKNLDNVSEQDIYLPIIHKYTSTPIDVLRIDLANIAETIKPYYEREEKAEAQTQKIEKIKKDGYILADLFVLASVLYNKPYTKGNSLDNLTFYDDGLNEAYNYIKQTLKNDSTPNISGLYSFMEVDKSTPLLREVVNYEFLPDAFPELTFKSCLVKNQLRSLQNQRDEFQTMCANIQDKEIRDDALKRTIELTKKLEEVKKAMNKINLEYSANMNTFTKQKNKTPKED